MNLYESSCQVIAITHSDWRPNGNIRALLSPEIRLTNSHHSILPFRLPDVGPIRQNTGELRRCLWILRSTCVNCFMAIRIFTLELSTSRASVSYDRSIGRRPPSLCYSRVFRSPQCPRRVLHRLNKYHIPESRTNPQPRLVFRWPLPPSNPRHHYYSESPSFARLNVGANLLSRRHRHRSRNRGSQFLTWLASLSHYWSSLVSATYKNINQVLSYAIDLISWFTSHFGRWTGLDCAPTTAKYTVKRVLYRLL